MVSHGLQRLSTGKLELTPEEEAVLKDQSFLLTKRIVSSKVMVTLEAYQDAITEYLQTVNESHQIRESSSKHPKISRGDNYGGLPYFVLDYPREFGQDETLAIRTMVWWGHFYSFTLHVSGPLKSDVLHRLIDRKAEFDQYYYCVNDTPWEYHYKPDNYQPLHSITQGQLTDDLVNRTFLKLSSYYPIGEHAHLQSRGLSFYEKIISLIA